MVAPTVQCSPFGLRASCLPQIPCSRPERPLRAEWREAVSRGFEVPTSGWFAATLDVTGAQAFDTHVDWIDVKVGGFSSSGTATVYLDSLSIDPPAVGPWDFASSASPLVVANEGNVHPEFVSGAITWRNY